MMIDGITALPSVESADSGESTHTVSFEKGIMISASTNITTGNEFHELLIIYGHRIIHCSRWSISFEKKT